MGGNQLVAHLHDLVERQRRGRQRVEHGRLVDVVAPPFHRGPNEQLVLGNVRHHVCDQLRRELPTVVNLSPVRSTSVGASAIAVAGKLAIAPWLGMFP